jgi:ABC-type sugar transport system ATPase subunit
MSETTLQTRSVAIHVRKVLKRYGSSDKPALNEVSLEVHPGELLAVLGPSGSGKTTMLNVLAGLEQVASGHVLFGDEDVTVLQPEQRGVGVVFQSSMLYPHLSLRDSISFAPRIAKVPKQEISRRIEEVTNWLNISHLLGRRPGEVSGGERQRAAIAKALVTQPRLLLMDEPFSAVDAQLRRQLRTELVKLHRRIGTTTIFVTHDQEEAMAIADRVAVMRDGELVQVGTPLELYRSPVNSWLADFVSIQPLNHFEAHVDDADRLVLLDGTLVVEGAQGLRRGSRVAVGVRPEHITMRPEPTATKWRILTQEMLGSVVKYVVRDTNGHEVTTVTTADEMLAPDQPVELRVDRGRCMVFDEQTGEALAGASAQEAPRVS